MHMGPEWAFLLFFASFPNCSLNIYQIESKSNWHLLVIQVGCFKVLGNLNNLGLSSDI